MKLDRHQHRRVRAGEFAVVHQWIEPLTDRVRRIHISPAIEGDSLTMRTVQQILDIAGAGSRSTAIAMAITLGPSDAKAAEGAASNYFPGAYGDFFVSVAPDPGPVFVDLNLFYSADVSTAVLQGTVNASLDTQA